MRARWAVAVLAGWGMGCAGGLDAEDTPDPPASSPTAPADAGATVRASVEAGVEAGAAPAPRIDAMAASPDVARPADAMPAAGELDYLGRVLPVLMIDVGGKTIPYQAPTKLDGKLKVIEDHDGTLKGIEARPATLEAKIGIEIRGNSSASMPQKPYGLEIRDDAGQDLAVPLLGLPRESDFVLHSCYADKSCMRNALIYAVSREMALTRGQWEPRTRYVELFIDGQYQGLYLLVEKIKRDKGRVAIPEPGADPAQGGYIVSNEGDVKKAPDQFWLDPMTGTRKWVYRSPAYQSITAAQKTYIEGQLGKLLQALAAGPRWGDLKKVVDAPSWIDYALVQELTNNTDAYYRSWYFIKAPEAAGGQWFMGPDWDYDRGFGNVNYGTAFCASTLINRQAPAPFKPLFADPTLRSETSCRYRSLRRPGGPLDVARIEAKIDAFAKAIAPAKARDQARWKNVGVYFPPSNYVGPTWGDEVQYLKYWIRRRLAWLDTNLPGTCDAMPAPPPLSALAPPPPIKETALRTAGAPIPVYIPIEGPVDPAYAKYACPM
jgi:hypothetical protein